MKTTRNEVKLHVRKCRAKQERITIQARDDMFRTKDERRFNIHQWRTECRKFMVDGLPKAVDNFVCLGVLRQYTLLVYASMPRLSLYTTTSDGIVTSLALKYLGVLQHPQAPTCLRPCYLSQMMMNFGHAGRTISQNWHRVEPHHLNSIRMEMT